jgi:hypothetical protein
MRQETASSRRNGRSSAARTPAPGRVAGRATTGAVRVRSIAALHALPVQEDRYAAQHHAATIEFISGLLVPRLGDASFEVVLVADPATIGGRVEVLLLCRVRNEPTVATSDLAEDLLRRAEAYFPELDLEAVSPRDIRTLLRTSLPQSALAVRRRTRREALAAGGGDATRRGALGFARELRTSAPHAGSLVHVSPFMPTGHSFERLFRVMLSQRGRVTVTFRLRPAVINPEEEAFLEQQIATCERHAQLHLGQVSADADPEWLRPSLHQRSRALGQLVRARLGGLRASSALLDIEVTAGVGEPHLVAQAVGSLITQPPGATSTSDQGENLVGGFEVVAAGSPAQVEPGLPAGVARLSRLFDAREAAAAFRLPPAAPAPLSGVGNRTWRIVPPPVDLPEHGVLVGTAGTKGNERPVRLPASTLEGHMAILGSSGAGKSTLLKTLALSDIEAGLGVAVVDPHGDLFDDILRRIPAHRERDVVVFDPVDTEFPVGLNLLEWQNEAQRHFVVQTFVSLLQRLMRDEYGSEAVGSFAGPVFMQAVRNALLLAMSDPDDPATLLEFTSIFRVPRYWLRWLPMKVRDPVVERWLDNLGRSDLFRTNSDGLLTADWMGSKLDPFVFDPVLRNIVGQKRSTIHLGRIMEEGRILLVNLARGELGEDSSRFLGRILLARLQVAALARVRVPPARRRPFRLYVDEYQSMATETSSILLSEGRKFGLGCVLANQFLGQVTHAVVEGVLANARTMVAFRCSQADAERLAGRFAPVFSTRDLVTLPNFHACVSTTAGEPIQPFTVRTLPASGRGSDARARRIRQRSRRKHAVPVAEVRTAIEQALRAPANEKEG